jgi:FSR family fosmidomycin resistance protein-like MFS transporter
MIIGCLGGSFFHPQSMGFVNIFSGKNCSNNMGIFVSLGSVGFALGPLLAMFITQVAGLDKIYYTSFLGLTLAALMFFCVPKLSVSQKKNEHKKFFKSFKEILSNHQMKFLMLIAMMKSLVTNSSCVLLPFLWKSMNCTPFYIGCALFLFVFAGALGSFISPKLEKILGSKPIIYFSMWSSLPLMIIFALTYKTMPVISMANFAVIGFTTMLAQPVTLVWAQRILPQYKSIVAGFINGFCWGVIALLMSVLGTFAEKYGIVNVLIILAIIPAIASYFVRYLKNQKEC